MQCYIRPISAQLNHDHDEGVFNRQDPYCVINIGAQRFQTQPAYGGGRFPSWGETFQAFCSPMDMLVIQVWDRDMVTPDDFIGQAMVTVQQLMTTPMAVPLQKNGMPVGSINVTVTSGMGGMGMPGMGMGMGMPPMGMGGMGGMGMGGMPPMGMGGMGMGMGGMGMYPRY